jgi:hypothetical protein
MIILRRRKGRAGPTAETCDNPSIESPSFTTGSRRFRTARAEAIPRHRAKENYRSEKERAIISGAIGHATSERPRTLGARGFCPHNCPRS